jgi:Bacterial regulatory proteins, luxR family
MIAHDLEISERTVEVHRARMLERLRTRSIAEAIRIAVVAGLGSAAAEAPLTRDLLDATVSGPAWNLPLFVEAGVLE